MADATRRAGRPPAERPPAHIAGAYLELDDEELDKMFEVDGPPRPRRCGLCGGWRPGVSWHGHGFASCPSCRP